MSDLNISPIPEDMRQSFQVEPIGFFRQHPEIAVETIRKMEARIAELEAQVEHLLQQALDASGDANRYREALEAAATYRNEMPPTCWVVIDDALNP